jgi:protein TonB
MFEQTFVTDTENARKPYSMALSLVFQILIIGALCVLPFVFTQTLPTMQLKGVLAAPRAPSVLKPGQVPTHTVTAAPRVFHLSDLLVRVTKPAAFNNSVRTEEAPPSVGEIGIPDGVSTDGITPALLVSAPPPLPATKPAPKKQGPIRVGTIAAANIIHMVQPMYPPLAKASRISGSVEFTATISKVGTIENLQLVRGHPLLVNAAKDAVLQWRYRPTLLNGEPVEVITDIVVNFLLNQ